MTQHPTDDFAEKSIFAERTAALPLHNTPIPFVSLSHCCPDFFTPRKSDANPLPNEFSIIYCEEKQIERMVYDGRYRSLHGLLVTMGNEVHIEPVTGKLWHFSFIPSMLPRLKTTLTAFGALLQNELQTNAVANSAAGEAESIITGAISSFPGAIYQFYANEDGSRGFRFFSEGVEKFLGEDIPIDNAFNVIMSRVHPDDLPGLMQSIDTSIRTRSLWQYEARFILPDGRTVWVEAVSTPQETKTGVVFNGLLRDTTEQHKMRETIIQTEKMISIGGLAAGIAHEINNPLAGLRQSIQVLNQRLNLSHPSNQPALKNRDVCTESLSAYFTDRHVYRLLQSMADACERVGTIVHDMLRFARDDHREFSFHDAAALLDQTLNIASTDYNLKKKYDFKQIQLIKEYDAMVPQIECIPSEVQQVFMNILKNGAQAMYDAHAAHGIASKFFLRTEYDRKSDMVTIEIRDNGPGIEDDVRSHIFDPFFSTKSSDTGTGLGLSVSYFIVTQTHNGELFVCPNRSPGACFLIRLPRVQPVSPFVVSGETKNPSR